MNVYEFGNAKLRLRDIDPLYWAVWDARLPLKVRQRYTLAEVAFDHAGLAAQITESNDFWRAMQEAARTTLRGAPRRYYRGEKAQRSLRALQVTYVTPERAISALQGTYKEVEALICSTWPEFGKCAAFKLADMAERVCCNNIEFSNVTVTDLCTNRQVKAGFDKAAQPLKKLLAYNWVSRAGPRLDRRINQQELETILCYFSHDDAHSKHLPGMDIEGIRKELTGWGRLADKLISHLPKRRT